MKNFGEHTGFQIKFNKIILALLFVLLMVKAYYITEVGLILFEDTYNTWRITLEMFGFNFEKVLAQDGTKQYHIMVWESIMFEVLAILINFALHKYYISQNDWKIRK